MKKLTQIQKLMAEGWTIQVSEVATEGHPFVAVDEAAGIKHIVFHPMDYNYAAYPDWQTAHEVNMTRIYQKIDDMIEIALQKLDMMVDTMNSKHDPKLVTFFPNVEAEEMEDGTFRFFARPAFGDDAFRSLDEQEIYANAFVDGGLIIRKAVGGPTYAQLKNQNGGEEPTFDQLLKGAV